MSISITIHVDAEVADIGCAGAACNPHAVMLELGRYGDEGTIYFNPEQARRAAAVLLADAVRCETWQAERALRALAQPAPVVADLDEVVF